MPPESPDRSRITSTRELPPTLQGDKREAFDHLFALLYQELRALARWHRQRRPADTLTTTALVHEAYLKLSVNPATGWAEKRHFFAVAALAMRQIIIDHSREVLASKRGGGSIRLSIDEVDVSITERAEELVKLDEALTELGTLNPRLSQIVDLRFFAGLSVDETADVLGSSPRTVKRDWRKARAFLFQTLTSGNPDSAQIP